MSTTRPRSKRKGVPSETVIVGLLSESTVKRLSEGKRLTTLDRIGLEALRELVRELYPRKLIGVDSPRGHDE